MILVILADAFSVLKPGDMLTFLACVAVLLGIALGVKTLFFPAKSVGMSQPFIIALEKEFVTKHEADKRHQEIHQEVKEVRAYAHDEIHKLNGVVNAVMLDARERGETLSALDERSKNQARVLEGMAQKIDRIVERVADKVEEILRNGGRK